MEDDITFDEDSENYKSGSIGIKEIAMMHFNRCIIEGSKEMSRAGIKTKIVKGQVIELDVPNQREVFINCVKMFETILVAYLKDRMTDEFKRIDSMIIKVDDDFTINYKRLKVLDSQKKINWNESISNLQDQYEREVLRLYQLKLKELSVLMNALNYFGEVDVIG